LPVTPTPCIKDAAGLAVEGAGLLKGHIAIARAVFPEGTTGAPLDSFARQFLWTQGLDFDHGTGHGVGSYLSVHEGPARISKLGTTALKPGMILSKVTSLTCRLVPDHIETAEHPFGTLKMSMGATHFPMKRLPKIATEMALHVPPTFTAAA
jgi:hypothetical protein